MKIAKLILLLLLGTLAVYQAFNPTSSYFGLVFPLIGLLYYLSLSVFIYYALALLLGLFLKKKYDFKFHTTAGLILVLLIGSMLSFILNIPVYRSVKKHHEADITLENTFATPDTLAFYSKQYNRKHNTRRKPSCDSLCENLLYNGQIKKFLVITSPKTFNKDIRGPVLSYSLGTDAECINKKLKITSVIESGRCIVESRGFDTKADIVFFQDRKTEFYTNALETSFRSKRKVTIDSIELLKNNIGQLSPIYRYSKIEGHRYTYPPAFGIQKKINSNKQNDYGFITKKIKINDPQLPFVDIMETYKPQIESLFGKVLEPIPFKKIDQTVLLQRYRKDFQKDNAADQSFNPKTVALYLQNLTQNKKTPTDRDLQKLTKLLKEEENLYGLDLPSFIKLWSREKGDLPNEFMQALANRIISKNNINRIPFVMRELPEKNAASIYPQIMEIVNNPNLIKQERMRYVVARLADGGKKAIPEYIKILQEQAEAQEPNESTLGALLGLCTLGAEAGSVKNILLNKLQKNNFRNSIAKDYTHYALIEMGAADELRKIYEENFYRSQEIEKIIAHRHRINKRNRTLCKN